MDALIRDAERAATVRARDAASLIVVQGGASVLMGLRGAGHRFMPNKLVFPGGRVDRPDATAAVGAPLRPVTRRLLEQAAKPRAAQALAHAAARELEEETGLTLGSPPDLDGLDYLCRAVTPPVSPIRFNARFLVTDAARVGGTLAGSGELEDLRWFGIEEALALDLAWITRGVLGQLQAYLAMTLAERDAREATSVCRSKSWRMERARH